MSLPARADRRRVDAQRCPRPVACRRVQRRPRAAGGDQRGFTLVELLIAMVLTLVIIGGPLTFMIVSANQSNASSSRSSAARAVESTAARLVRELREAQKIEDPVTGTNLTPVTVTYGGGAAAVQFYLPRAGSTGPGTKVTWSCTAGGSCTRAVGGVAATMLSGVTVAVFTPLDATTGATLPSGAGAANPPSFPSSVQVTLGAQVTSQLDPSQTHTAQGANNPIVVQDGVTLRNYA